MGSACSSTKKTAVQRDSQRYDDLAYEEILLADAGRTPKHSKTLHIDFADDDSYTEDQLTGRTFLQSPMGKLAQCDIHVMTPKRGNRKRNRNSGDFFPPGSGQSLKGQRVSLLFN